MEDTEKKKEQSAIKDKYRMTIVFDGDQEARIRACAKSNNLPVASFVKFCVSKELDRRGF